MNGSKISTSAAALMASVLLFSGCHGYYNNDVTTVPPMNTNPGGSYYTPTTKIITQTYDYHNYNGFNGYLNEGTYLSIPPNAFVDVNGIVVQGRVDLSIVEILKKSEMFLDSISTVTDSALLESGGILQISASQYGNPIALNSGVHISAVFPVSGSPLKMKFYNGTLSKYGYLDWTPDKDSVNYTVSTTKDSTRTGASYVYNLISAGTGWIGAQHLAGLGPLTTIGVHVSNTGAFTNAKSALVFTSINSVAIMNKDTGTNNFIIADMPVGSKATLVVYARKGGLVYSAFVPVTISSGMKNSVTLTPNSEGAFDTKLKALD